MRIRFKPGDTAFFIDKPKGEIVGAIIQSVHVNSSHEVTCKFIGFEKRHNQFFLYKTFQLAEHELRKMQDDDKMLEKEINIDGGRK